MLRSPVNVKESIPLDMLDSDFGGTWSYDFKFDNYWNTLIDFCGIAPDGTRTHPTKARIAEKVKDDDGVTAEKDEVEGNGETEAATAEVPTIATEKQAQAAPEI